MFVDADFDHKIYAHMIVNSEALLVDKWGSRSGGNVWDRNWRANAKVATHIGSDFWSLEYELRFDSERFPHPSPGTLWGFNVVRVVHGQEYCQWVRTEDSGHKPDEFGFLRFR